MGKYGSLSNLQYNLIARLLDNSLNVLFCTFQNSVATASAMLLANQCLVERLGLWKDRSTAEGELGSLHLLWFFMKFALCGWIFREKIKWPEKEVSWEMTGYWQLIGVCRARLTEEFQKDPTRLNGWSIKQQIKFSVDRNTVIYRAEKNNPISTST